MALLTILLYLPRPNDALYLRVTQVAHLVSEQSAIGMGTTPKQRAAQLLALPPMEARRGGLEDVCGWLVINSMRTERVQFEVWALHCARNAWRKKAMARLCKTHAAFGEGGSRPLLSAESLDLFREEVDHDVSNSVPVPVDSTTSIRTAAAGDPNPNPKPSPRQP